MCCTAHLLSRSFHPEGERRWEVRVYPVPVLYVEALPGIVHVRSDLASQQPYYETGMIHTCFRNKEPGRLGGSVG